MRHLSSLELVQPKRFRHRLSAPTASTNVVKTKDTRILHEAFALCPCWRIVCDLQNTFHRPVSFNPHRRAFGHLKMRNQSGVDIRRVANVNLVIAQLQYICEEAIAVCVIGRSSESHVFVGYVNVRPR